MNPGTSKPLNIHTSPAHETGACAFQVTGNKPKSISGLGWIDSAPCSLNADLVVAVDFDRRVTFYRHRPQRRELRCLPKFVGHRPGDNQTVADLLRKAFHARSYIGDIADHGVVMTE